MYGLSIAIISSLVTYIFSWYLAYDPVTCSIEGAGTRSVNGYYAAVGGMYIKRGEEISYFPDVFEVFSLRKNIGTASTIAMTKHSWAIYSDVRKLMIYKNIPEHPDEFISEPPTEGWIPETGKLPAPSIVGCKGSLQDSPSLPSSSQSNISQMLERPVTTFLLAVIFYTAYVLWSSRTEVSDVSFSYDAVLNQGEYWRMVTASFSHFDAWHLLFNTMSLFQLGELEVTYGSVTFAFLNADLVFITMGICVLSSHIMIYKFNRVDQASSQAVGFSCVLFAWMVAASVRMKQYCPIFLLPTLCFTTYFIPNPLASFSIGPITGFPVNIGPILLLVITKVIIPRSSFLGHLSGIVIGYPLAWNALNWLTPPIAFSLIAIIIIYKDKLLPMNFTGYDVTVTDYTDLGSIHSVRRFKHLRLTMFILLFFSTISFFLLSLRQHFPRVVLMFVVWGAVQSRRCEWLSTLRSTHDDCIALMYLSVIGTIVAILYDISSLASSCSAFDLLMGCSLTKEYLYSCITLLTLLIITEIAFFISIISCLNDIKLAETILTKFRLNNAALKKEFNMLGLNYFYCCNNGNGNTDVGFLSNRHVFDGPGRKLNVTSTSNTTSLLSSSANTTSLLSPIEIPDEETNLLISKKNIMKISKDKNKNIGVVRNQDTLPTSIPFPIIPSSNHSGSHI